MVTDRTTPIRGFRERRLAVGKGIRDLEQATGIHRARLSPIERGMLPSLQEHGLIDAALARWEEEVRR